MGVIVLHGSVWWRYSYKINMLRLSILTLLAGPSLLLAQAPAPAKPPFTYQQLMIPVRDGVRLQTVILTPADQKGPLPILLLRTPYGVPDKAPAEMPVADDRNPGRVPCPGHLQDPLGRRSERDQYVWLSRRGAGLDCERRADDAADAAAGR